MGHDKHDKGHKKDAQTSQGGGGYQPQVNDEVSYFDPQLTIGVDGVIEALNGTDADIRITSDNRLEEAVQLQLPDFSPLRYYTPR